MRFAHIILILGASLVAAVAAASNDPARFWISTSMDSPIVGEAPTINAPIGKQMTLYIWATPATDNTGAFRTIDDFSLNVVTQTANGNPEPEPFIDFVDGTFKVYDDEVAGLPKRFQAKTDSSRPEAQGGALTSDRSAADVASGLADAIKGLEGVSPTSTAGLVGIGNNADPPPYHVGSAWRIAEFAFQALQPGVDKTTTNRLFLQVGFAGVLSRGTGDTYLWLGNDALESSKYDATCPKKDGCATQRELTLSDDTFDIQINAVSFTPGDYNRDGVVGPADYAYWRSSFGTSVNPGDGADGNGNGVIDAGDYVFWRKIMASGNVIPFIPGDYNSDGTVGMEDYAVWRSTFGQSVAVGQGADGNGDGIIDAADYVFWRKIMASGSGASNLTAVNSNTTVPEPGTVVLVSILGAVASLLNLNRFRQGRDFKG